MYLNTNTYTCSKGIEKYYEKIIPFDVQNWYFYLYFLKPSRKLHVVDLKEDSANFDQFWYFKNLISFDIFKLWSVLIFLNFDDNFNDNFHTWRYWLKILINVNTLIFKPTVKSRIVDLKVGSANLIILNTWKLWFILTLDNVTLNF